MVGSHVYADTFSHYGFSGVSSRKNRIEDESLRIVNCDQLDESLQQHIDEQSKKFQQRYGREGGFLPNIKRWWRSVKSEGAEFGSGALGHGAVLTFPDRPYLHWEFRYENREGVQNRDNPATFLEAAEALHGMFARVREERDNDGADNGRPWDEVAERVKGAWAEGRARRALARSGARRRPLRGRWRADSSLWRSRLGRAAGTSRR